MKRLSFLIFILGLMTSLPAYSADYDQGLLNYWMGNYEAAYQEFKPLADQGMPEAQNYLGEMYSRGEGVALDNSEAVKWYRKAAEQGYPVSQSALGVMYQLGKGVPQDLVTACMWYTIAISNDKNDMASLVQISKSKVEQDMSSSEKVECAQRAAEWVKNYGK